MDPTVVFHDVRHWFAATPSPVVAAVSSGATLLAGRWWGQYQARKQFESRDYLDRINVSLNILSDGGLQIRTILDRPLGEIVHNAHAVSRLAAAARGATENDPLVRLAGADAPFVLNCILNATAEHFSAGMLRRDCGEPVARTEYAFFLACEPVAERRQHKIRALLIKSASLRDFPYLRSMPVLERTWHTDRVMTLRRAAATYPDPNVFGRLELCV